MKMKLFNVTITHTMPVGADSARDAKDLVLHLLTSGKYPHDAIGFDHDNCEAYEIKSLREVPKDWENAPIFNTADLDNIEVKDVLKEYLLKEENVKHKLNKTLNSLRDTLSKEDVIKLVENIYSK